MEYCCSEMEEYSICKNVSIKSYEDKPILYSDKFDEYGIKCSDELSSIQIKYCPWCGKKLSDSLRMRWFSELQSLGYLTPLFDDSIPEKYKTNKWWSDERTIK